MKRTAVCFLVLLTLAGVLTGCMTMPEVADSITFDTSTLQNVSRISDDRIAKDWAMISPDGKKMLYCESDRVITRKDYSNEAVESYKVMLLNDVTKFAKTPLINEYSTAPTWSEDNTAFVYVVLEGRSSKLVRSNITGGGKTYITRNAIGSYDSRPDILKHEILCDTTINGRQQIVSLHDNGTEVTVLGEGHSPTWHSTGKKFVFIRNDSVYEMDLVTNQATQIYAEPDMACRNPSYSQDGQHILFQKEANVSVTVNDSSGKSTRYDTIRWHLYTVKTDGTNLSQLTNGNVDVFSPSWGPGNTIYFISNAGGFTEIWKAVENLS
jgi:TolB protein